jgi:hypothetical protein
MLDARENVLCQCVAHGAQQGVLPLPDLSNPA